jgi:glycosyltransferase involved in cell wall biosynthesis
VTRGKVADGFRVLYLINGLGPGGAERSLAELLPLYLERGIRPVIVCLRRRELGVEAAVRSLGCDVRFLPPGGVFQWVPALRRMIARDPVHLVHTTLFESDIVGRLAAAGSGIPVLTSLVNTSYEPVRLEDPNVRTARLAAVKGIDGWTARWFTAHFHAITEAVRRSAVEQLRIREDEVTVVERGRDRARLGVAGAERRRAVRSRLGLSEDDEVIVNVARQEYQKGQCFLLEAVGILARSRPRIVVLVCGREGHMTSDLERLHARLRLGDRVRILGDRTDVPDLLAAADLFVFPSLYEGLGGAVIEAMALGLPIVASDIPALREVVEDGRNGLLVRPGSGEALAAAVRGILEDRGRAAAFGARSRMIFDERFTIERSAERMIRLYRQVGLAPGAAPGAAPRTAPGAVPRAAPRASHGGADSRSAIPGVASRRGRPRHSASR